MSSNEQPEKFEFDVDFQWEIIKYILLDKNGYKVNLLISHDYFDLDYQKIIVRGIQRYSKRKKRIVPTPGYLNEEIRSLFKTKDYAKSFNELDRDRILRKTKRLFKSPPKDPDEIFERVKTFASYVQMKRTLEGIDVTNYAEYQQVIQKLQKAVNIGMELNEKGGLLMVTASKIRIAERHNRQDVVPTPWPQLNLLTNGGGFNKGSVITIMDRPKKGKTVALVNLACSYLKNRAWKNNRVIFFDFENGDTAIATRVDQCLAGLEKRQVMSGEFDKKLLKIYRQLARFKSELYIKRMPAYSTTADCQKVLDDLKQEYGVTFNVAIFDFIALMGCMSGKTEDVHRISDAYVDVKNFAAHNDLDCVWTAHHVKREAYGRRLSKFKPDDLAKCIDIERHVDALLALQQSEEDIKMNILRMEIIAMRDGLPNGRVLFKQNIKLQRMKPLPLEEVKEYNLAYGTLYNEGVEDDGTPDHRDKKKKQAKSDLS